MNIREQIVKDIRDALAQIKIVDGYNTDIGNNVNVWTGEVLGAYNCPVCLIVDDGEDIIEDYNQWQHDLNINIAVVLSEPIPDYRTKLLTYVDDIYKRVKDLIGQDGHCYDLGCKGDKFNEETEATFIATTVIMMNAHYTTDKFSLR